MHTTGFLYYLPLSCAPTQSALNYAFAHTPTVAQLREGPDRGPGLLLADGTRLDPKLIRYIPDSQAWISSPLSDAWLCAIPPVTPQCLARESLTEGQDVQLADGNHWHIPFLKHAERTLVPGLNNTWTIGSVLGDFRPVIDLVDKFLRSDRCTYEDAANVAAHALGINYHLSLQELAALRLLTTTNVLRILETVTDLKGYIDILDGVAKKNIASDTLSTSSGEEGCDLATPQQQPTS